MILKPANSGPEYATTLVERRILAAMERGEFDDLPGSGAPLRNLNGAYDPDWWVKALVSREGISAEELRLARRLND